MPLTAPTPALAGRTVTDGGTAVDRVVDGLARLLVDTGTRLQDDRASHRAHRAAGAGTRRAVERRRRELGDRIRDNTAQINPLGLH